MDKAESKKIKAVILGEGFINTLATQAPILTPLTLNLKQVVRIKNEGFKVMFVTGNEKKLIDDATLKVLQGKNTEVDKMVKEETEKKPVEPVKNNNNNNNHNKNNNWQQPKNNNQDQTKLEDKKEEVKAEENK